jgi:hypothetical protein
VRYETLRDDSVDLSAGIDESGEDRGATLRDFDTSVGIVRHAERSISIACLR